MASTLPDSMLGAGRSPIAVVGMACRFPGATDVSAFWRLLVAGQSAITEGEPGSGVGRVGKLYSDTVVQNDACRFGGFIDGIDQFDAAFFRISPVEADLLDPQQRLMLEVSWQALEDAGINPEQLKGSRTGVYAGISNNEYRALVLDGSDTAEPAASLYSVSGTSFNTAIGRVAFVLGLQGPAMAVDTACSSSLVAVHQAVVGLQRGETDLALAGGVHAILSGRLFELRGNAGMLAPDGCCKTFDAAANGYVRGEGCGILVLKRLSDAETDGDRIWGVIRGTALNQDGASQGLTVPNGEAQERVIADALTWAAVQPSDVDYVETHGTGTPVGDPIEAQATGTAYSEGRDRDCPLLIGSVKTNIGHLESAAGVAALIKVILATKHGVIPKHLNFRDPNPEIDWERLPLQVTSESTPWPRHAGRPPLAGVSGFGWSGTNAHIVVEGYEEVGDYGSSHVAALGDDVIRTLAGPPEPVAVAVPAMLGDTPAGDASVDAAAARSARLLPLSAKTDAALRELASGYIEWLETHPGKESCEDDTGSREGRRDLAATEWFSDIAWTAGVGRGHFSHRAAVVSNDAVSLREHLAVIAETEKVGPSGSSSSPTVVFAYTGQASQWVGMGRALYESEPVYRAVLDRCDEIMLQERGVSLLDVMFGSGGTSEDLDDPSWTQPCIYALECGLTALWASVGVRPDVVVGHSLGEIAAAQTAGVFSLADGLKFAAVRGALMGASHDDGAMAAVFAPATQVAASVDELNTSMEGPPVSVAADNGMHQVISGTAAKVDLLLQGFETEEVRVRRLRKSPAYHSVLLEPILDDIEVMADSIETAVPSVTYVSSMTGRRLKADEMLNGSYWRRQAVFPVAFRSCVETLTEIGVDVVIEIGPNAVLGPTIITAWPQGVGAAAEPAIASSMQKPSASKPAPVDGSGFLDAVAVAYNAGVDISFDGLFAGESRRRVPLPAYPFQRSRHWVEPPRRRRQATGHPLLGVRHDSPRGETLFETEIFPSDPAWLDDHRVYGRVITPGALYGAMAVATHPSGVPHGSVAAATHPPGAPQQHSVVIEDFQLHSPMIFSDDDTQDAAETEGRRVQLVLDSTDAETSESQSSESQRSGSQSFEVFSRSTGEDEWILHAQGTVSSATGSAGASEQVDIDELKAGLGSADLAGFYQDRADVGVDLGASFRTLRSLWCSNGEALGEVALPDGVDSRSLDLHPILLDGCFQVMAAARCSSGEEGASGNEEGGGKKGEEEAVYLPFGWERLWLHGPLPDRLLCHAHLRELDRTVSGTDDAAPRSGDQPTPANRSQPGDGDGGDAAAPREVLAGDLRFYTSDGVELGGVDGYTVKRATQATLFSATEDIEELLYEMVWQDCPLAPGVVPVEFFPRPEALAARWSLFSEYLEAVGVDPASRIDLLTDLERLSWAYALLTLERLGWERNTGETVNPETLRCQFGVLPEHERLFRRLFEMLAKAGVVKATGDGFTVIAGPTDPQPEDLPDDPETFASSVAERCAHGSIEVGVFRRSAAALPDVLKGEADPLTLLFGSGEPTAADLYLKAPVAEASSRILADTVAALLEQLPDGRRLRVIEVGAGTGSATSAVLPEMPDGRFEYTYTDISAGFFAEAEERFGGSEASIEYRALDIEKDPGAQGFDHHAYDLVIASNVLHATRYLSETLGHCLSLLAPSGYLVALETLQGQGWLDLTFGALDGWWRFADSCRPHHALTGPDVWSQALTGAGFEQPVVLGTDDSEEPRVLDRGVIIAQGPAEITEPAGMWVLAGDQGGVATEIAEQLVERNQRVVLARAKSGLERRGEEEELTSQHVGVSGSDDDTGSPQVLDSQHVGVSGSAIDMESREDWRALLEGLPSDIPLNGVVHLVSLDSHGAEATVGELAADVRQAESTALALIQGVLDADVAPARGVWFVTRGGQVLEHERVEGLAGATLWGFGKVVAREVSRLQPRMIDLDPVPQTPTPALATRAMNRRADPVPQAPIPDLSDEFLYPDDETHIAYRWGLRQSARLVRAADTERLEMPEPAGGAAWILEPDEGGALEELRVEGTPVRPLRPQEVRVAVEAVGLNFLDMFRSLGVVDEGLLGGEFCGRVIEVGPDVTSVRVGGRVVGLAFGTFGSEAVTRETLVAPTPQGFPAVALATMPTVFVTCVLSFDFAGLESGDRVLIHAGAGGVGLAAVQLAQAAGAEVFATASAKKRAYLRSQGVQHVFDSRSTKFGEQILDVTNGEGVDVVLNSLTGPGFIEASLSCLAQGGRFVELARMDILSPEEMAEARPDVAYSILELDTLKENDPAQPGDALRRVMDRLATGELTPLTHTRWSLAEACPAMKFMRAARHIGKIVLAASSLETGQLRSDRTYLVTGGFGGIGCVVAGWLAERGAGTIVLNGRRDPDPEAVAVIADLRKNGIKVEVELADVSDAAAVEAMLSRIDETMPPLAGVIHSVGVLSDAALSNQSWEAFEEVLWPKVLGAWQLHKATEQRDLDLFVLFSSVAGVMGNPGQANHASANAFLDVLAAHRRSLGLAGQSIAWGAWSGLGEAEEHRERIAGQLEASGTGWITPQQGLKALDRVIRQDMTAPMVAAVDWQTVAESHESHSSLLADLLASAAGDPEDSDDSQADLMSTLAEATPEEREQVLAEFLQRQLQVVMRLPNLPAVSVEFSDLGMDSLMAVELRNRINRAFADVYTAGNTVVFDYPSIRGLSSYLATELAGVGELTGAGELTGDVDGSDGSTDKRFAIALVPDADGGEQTAALDSDDSRGEQSKHDQDRQSSELVDLQDVLATRDGAMTQAQVVEDGVAIVGMACRFPGAPDLQSFWRQLEAGANAVTDGRPGSDSWNGAVGDPTNPDPTSRVGAFIEGIDRFDAGFFGIRPIEARMMDPQQRMLMETTWQALEDAGIDPASLKGSHTGVYAGISGSSEYRKVIADSGHSDSYFGTIASVAVGRIAFTLGLAGPAVPFDLVCASSLVAVHHAVIALRRGEVDLALVGGVNAVLSPLISRFLAEVGMLSSSGQSWTFDAAADGFVRGEGCGMIVLKRLDEALTSGDQIRGVIRGTAVNQNATGLALTQPNSPAQIQVMEQALTQAGVAAADIDYLEAHGSGSALGDAVEMNAIAAVYGKNRDAGRPLLVGSVKTNIGHLERASAVAGLIKTVLAMNRNRIPKHLNLKNPSEQIDWERIPVRVTTEPTDWPTTSGRPRLAAVNSLAISGANAHLVLQEYNSMSAEGTTIGCPIAVGSVDGDSDSAGRGSVGGVPAGGDPAGGEQPQHRMRLLPLSARSDEALRELAGRYLSWLDDKQAAARSMPVGTVETLLADMTWTASVGRKHFECRSAVLFNDIEDLRKGLRTVAGIQQDSESRREGGDASTDIAMSSAVEDVERKHGSRSPNLGDSSTSLERAVADYEAGLDVSFPELFEGETRHRISLPGYPFQRRRYWVEPLRPKSSHNS